MSSSRLLNKIAIVTGASSGIGRATALLFASHGAKLICADITPTPRPEHRTDTSPLPTVDAIRAHGGTATFTPCDTTSASAVEALVAEAVTRHGRLDIMVNNAGISVEAGGRHGARPVWEFEQEAFERTMAVNVTGVFLGVKYASRQMVGQEPGSNGDRGWIVNLASVYGLGGGTGIAAYTTSKHAVLGLTKTAACDCAPHRIHVNALCPGYTQTSFIHGLLGPEGAAQRAAVETLHPFRGLGTPRDVASAALFLASEDASWVTGVGLAVDGGYSCV